ncbi:TraR/DksA C4-type zinc finger protein [Candidatus Daviesbacteria bacterium]|nr:TraR/DksA C4-type zinc finger protein [Candidatus Daviesbacteria bacterium]
MLDLKSKTVKLIKNKLLRQKSEVEVNLKEVEQDDPALETVVESSEPGTDSYIAETHTRSVILMSNLKKIRENIKKSLEKIKSGIYGKCEKCGKQIETARLIVMPTADYCVSCNNKKK